MDGDEIRRAREAQGWTQRELGERMGVTGRTVRNWERTGAMHGRNAARLAAVLHPKRTTAQKEREPKEREPLDVAALVAAIGASPRRFF
jgi:transcriptional regulator with XRE-family HTH domain